MSVNNASALKGSHLEKGRDFGVVSNIDNRS